MLGSEIKNSKNWEFYLISISYKTNAILSFELNFQYFHSWLKTLLSIYLNPLCTNYYKYFSVSTSKNEDPDWMS